MAELMRRTSRQQAPGSPKELRIFWRDDVIVLDRGVLGKLRRQLMGQGPRNRQLPRVASSLLDEMWRQVRGERGRERGREAFDDDMLSSQAFVDFALSWWPPLDSGEVLGWLCDPEFLARVGEGIVSPEEQRLLVESWQIESLSVEDVPLVDELRYALGDVPDRREEDHELDDFLGGDLAGEREELTTAMERTYGRDAPVWMPPTHTIEDDGYAHVLIDEAQDLTPMQWRMVGRRGRAATWTIVGDAAQSSWPVPAESAAARAAAIAGKDLHEFHLSTNYRNSSEIYGYAAAFASRVGLDADLPTAVRSTGVEPREVAAGDDLAGAVRSAVGQVAGDVAGTVAIVVPVERRDEVAGWLASWPELAVDAPHATDGATGGAAGGAVAADDRLVVLVGIETKGLEFDGIVVVDPDAIQDESPTGRATLYVVLTRATQLLTLVRPGA
jgi:hypothetical protein